MRNLPTLPGCGRAATRRVEAFAGATPVATLYVCAQHVGPAKATFGCVGLIAHSMPYRPAPDTSTVLQCGDGIDYTGTIVLTAPDTAVDGRR